MRRVRVIPSLLIANNKLVKTVKFRNPNYIGDPINALRIFNEKEVDELAILDITASATGKVPDIAFVKQLATECFMPLSYGGGISTLAQATAIVKAGIEKIILGTAAHRTPALVSAIAKEVGSQSVVVSVDVSKDFFGRTRLSYLNGTRKSSITPVAFAQQMQELGAGEILLQNIDAEGTGSGFNTELIQNISKAVSIPVIASGGAAKVEDFLLAVKAGASAVSAGYMFVYKGSRNSVLISYPTQQELSEKLFKFD